MRITHYVEQPSAQGAEALFLQGALWTTFVMAAAARELEALAAQHLPRESALFDRYRRALGGAAEERALADLYERLQPSDFSRDVLQPASDLRAVQLSPCGWSDWGTPQRVLESLKGTAEHPPLMRRIERSSYGAALASSLASATSDTPDSSMATLS
jgi:mannose-1-phosphate guanylyltransferase